MYYEMKIQTDSILICSLNADLISETDLYHYYTITNFLRIHFYSNKNTPDF